MARLVVGVATTPRLETTRERETTSLVAVRLAPSASHCSRLSSCSLLTTRCGIMPSTFSRTSRSNPFITDKTTMSSDTPNASPATEINDINDANELDDPARTYREPIRRARRSDRNSGIAPSTAKSSRFGMQFPSVERQPPIHRGGERFVVCHNDKTRCQCCTQIFHQCMNL